MGVAAVTEARNMQDGSSCSAIRRIRMQLRGALRGLQVGENIDVGEASRVCREHASDQLVSDYVERPALDSPGVRRDSGVGSQDD